MCSYNTRKALVRAESALEVDELWIALLQCCLEFHCCAVCAAVCVCVCVSVCVRWRAGVCAYIYIYVCVLM